MTIKKYYILKHHFTSPVERSDPNGNRHIGLAHRGVLHGLRSQPHEQEVLWMQCVNAGHSTTWVCRCFFFQSKATINGSKEALCWIDTCTLAITRHKWRRNSTLLNTQRDYIWGKPNQILTKLNTYSVALWPAEFISAPITLK